ncbi:MAG: hypothetical protein OXB86_06190, partial [Bdellovibrionales bacterium]|nr:hypothetical protein [Bdellovibrionales bacterium]
MIVKKTLSMFICLVLLANCATSPGSISPQYVSKKKYQDYSCNELTDERDNVQRELTALTASMESKRGQDAGMVVVGFLLFFV